MALHQMIPTQIFGQNTQGGHGLSSAPGGQPAGAPHAPAATPENAGPAFDALLAAQGRLTHAGTVKAQAIQTTAHNIIAPSHMPDAMTLALLTPQTGAPASPAGHPKAAASTLAAALMPGADQLAAAPSHLLDSAVAETGLASPDGFLPDQPSIALSPHTNIITNDKAAARPGIMTRLVKGAGASHHQDAAAQPPARPSGPGTTANGAVGSPELNTPSQTSHSDATAASRLPGEVTPSSPMPENAGHTHISDKTAPIPNQAPVSAQAGRDGTPLPLPLDPGAGQPAHINQTHDGKSAGTTLPGHSDASGTSDTSRPAEARPAQQPMPGSPSAHPSSGAPSPAAPTAPQNAPVENSAGRRDEPAASQELDGVTQAPPRIAGTPADPTPHHQSVAPHTEKTPISIPDGEIAYEESADTPMPPLKNGPKGKHAFRNTSVNSAENAAGQKGMAQAQGAANMAQNSGATGGAEHAQTISPKTFMPQPGENQPAPAAAASDPLPAPQTEPPGTPGARLSTGPDSVRAAEAMRSTAPGTQPLLREDSLHDMAAQIRRQMDAGRTRFDIRMDPPELGRLDIRLDFSGDGRIQANLIAERPETYEALRQDLRALERALNEAGVKTDQGSLNLSLRGEGQGRFSGSDQNGNTSGNSTQTDDPAAYEEQDFAAGQDGIVETAPRPGVDLKV